MAANRITFRPRGGLWISTELQLEYFCTERPQVRHTRVLGVKKLGFILCYEDQVNAVVHTWKAYPCNDTSCDEAIRYEVEIKLFLSCEIGLGIGLGNFGTSVFGISLPSDEEIITVRTDCICCDSELRHKWPRETHSDSAGGMPRRSAIPLVASIAGVAAGVIVLDFLYPESEVLAYALPALLAGMATSLLIALIRARKLMAAVRRGREARAWEPRD